jgi:Meiotically up-regulated gene 113
MPSIRFHIEPRDVRPPVAARRLGLTLGAFEEALPSLLADGFPAVDETTGNYDLRAIDVWSNRKKGYRKPIGGANPRGFVYFIRCLEFIKIGFSEDVQGRLLALQACCPIAMTLLLAFAGGLKTEAKLHRKFRHLRHANEWFRAEDELLAFIEWIRNDSQELVYGVHV